MERRNFLKNIGVIGVAVAAPVTIVRAANDKPGTSDLSVIALKGRVSSAGKAISGVAVTDGLNVTITNANGEYNLVTNKTTKFVYISMPSGYEFPHEESLVKFFKEIDHSNEVFNASFELKKLSKNDDKHTFIVFSDPQIQNTHDAQLLLEHSAPDLKALIDTYPKDALIHGIGCGDLVWDNFALFADYKRAIGMSGVPFFNVIGNHDMDIDARSDEGSSETFKKHFGPTYYSYNRGQIHYIVLDDVFFIGAAKKYIGYVTETQLQWLEQDLKLVKAGSTVVLSLHIPTFTGQPRREKSKEDGLGGSVANRKLLYEMLKGFQVHIMSGHTHFNETWQEDHITEHVHGTVCGGWWTGDICGDGTPNGYGVYEVDGGKLSWYYKATGKPKAHQIRIYPPGKHTDFREEVCINIWNWDKRWQVECFADGRSIGIPEQRTAYDPMAVDLLEGDLKPTPRGWVDPILTDHLFFVKAPLNVKIIKVVAKDLFGQVYTETLIL